METPYLLIDEKILDNNISRMACDVKNLGCKLRPHVKTHKNIEIAKKQIAAGACGITVAKLGEAEIMASGNIDDIFIAYPIIGQDKIKRALDLHDKVARLILTAESLEGATALSNAALEAGITFEVRMEVDTGLKRTGVPIEYAKDLARKISLLDGLNLKGIFTFKGALYKGKPTHDYKLAGREEGEMLLSLKDELDFIYHLELSGGSTSTGLFTAEVDGIDEIRPGTYAFNDAMQIASGRCDVNDCAVKIFYTVVSAHEDGRLVVDGGSKSISTDITPNTPPYNLNGYGICPDDKFAILDRLSEEHGVVRLETGAHKYKVGDTICFISNHVCTTVNLIV